MAYDCPLCGTGFEHADCRSACPMSRGCTMVRCPRCGYEFVESGKLADMLRRWIRRGPVAPVGAHSVRPQPPHEDAAVRRLTDLGVGASASFVCVSAA